MVSEALRLGEDVGRDKRTTDEIVDEIIDALLTDSEMVKALAETLKQSQKD